MAETLKNLGKQRILLFLDIHNLFKNIHNSFMDINNSFMDILK